MPLFVGRNVLFVGTMNEDETTQTLSDKVIDRANVLRFGSPNQLAAPPATAAPANARAAANGVDPRPHLLAFAEWRSWQRDALGEDLAEEVDALTQRLSDALRGVGRSFAHRTHQAMRQYVANYPDADRYREALADQVEQKVLPRLRGLDPADDAARRALVEVRKVCDDLGDETLSRAIGDASRAGEHQFLWHGVDRAEADL